jgi:hypothetical protein
VHESMGAGQGSRCTGQGAGAIGQGAQCMKVLTQCMCVYPPPKYEHVSMLICDNPPCKKYLPMLGSRVKVHSPMLYISALPNRTPLGLRVPSLKKKKKLKLRGIHAMTASGTHSPSS